MRTTFSILAITLFLAVTFASATAFAGGPEECVVKGNDSESNKGNYFNGNSAYSSELVETLISAMTHSCFVTQKKNEWVKDFLRKSKWTLADGGLMKTLAGRGYVAYSKKLKTMVVVFRGTGVKGPHLAKLLTNALTDARMLRNKIKWLPKKDELGKWKGLNSKAYGKWSKFKVHKGFNAEYNRFAPKVESGVASILKKYKPKQVYCIGFSLGAALATHCGAHLKLRFGLKPNVIAGASPRVGSESFQKAYDALLPNVTRIMLEKDPVAQLPGNLTQKKFEHVGDLLPMFYGKSNKGKRLSGKDVEKRAHSWRNLFGGVVKFAKYHNYLKYKDALTKHLKMYCPGKCKGSTLKKLADAERKDSYSLVGAIKKAAKKVKEKAKEVKEKVKKKAKKIKDKVSEGHKKRKAKRQTKAECKKKCKQKTLKARRACKKKCK
jgi:predicted esterase